MVYAQTEDHSIYFTSPPLTLNQSGAQPARISCQMLLLVRHHRRPMMAQIAAKVEHVRSQQRRVAHMQTTDSVAIAQTCGTADVHYRGAQRAVVIRRASSPATAAASAATQHVLDGRRLQQPLQHAAAAAMLQALVRRQRVLGAVAPMAELAHVQRVRLLVLVLEVALQRVVAREGAPTVRALLRLVDAAARGRRHAQRTGDR